MRFFFVLLLMAAPLAAEPFPKSGTYEGSAEYNGRLRVVVDGREAAIFLKAANCVGFVEGHLARNPRGEVFLLSSGYKTDGCAVRLEVDGAFYMYLKPGPECTSLHGAACGFGGYVERVR